MRDEISQIEKIEYEDERREKYGRKKIIEEMKIIKKGDIERGNI